MPGSRTTTEGAWGSVILKGGRCPHGACWDMGCEVGRHDRHADTVHHP